MAGTRAALLAAFLATGLSAAALAHGGATGVVKERMDLMSDMAGAMKRTLAALKADRPLDAEAVTRDIRMVAGHSREMARLFPEGSIEGPSEATPAVWEDWSRFEALAVQTAERADALLKAVEFGERRTAMQRFAALGRSCSACHEHFRQTDEDGD